MTPYSLEKPRAVHGAVVCCLLAVATLVSGCPSPTPEADGSADATIADAAIDATAVTADAAIDARPVDVTSDTGADVRSCTGSLLLCGSACVDPRFDPMHCGACETACPSGQVCSNGTCSLLCLGGTQMCSGACVNTANDPAHCGACETACGATQVCSAGACRCRAGDSMCGGACVNVATSALHCGACGVACAAGQTCNGGTCGAPAVGNGGVGGALTGAATPRVAVVGAATWTDLQTKLQATGAFSAVDFFNANTAAPSLATLRNYDAVVFYTYLAVPSTFGDTLASYFEAGGGVVLADYETQERGTYGLSGRFQTAYAMSATVPSSGFSSTPVTLGTLVEPSSPLLNGVTSFSYTGSSPYHLPSSAFSRTENNPVVVARFSDGTPAIVRGSTAGGRRLCEINGFAVSSADNSNSGWTASTNGAQVFRNALLYVRSPALSVATQASAGSIAQFASGAPITITYTNASSATQTLNAVRFTGAMSADFAVTPSAALPAMIPAGGTFTVTVTASPSAVGLRAATLDASFAGFATPATTLVTATGT